MRKRGFTLLELLLAVVLLGLMTTVSIATYRAITTGWRVSRDYVDRLERTDYALDQLVSALRGAYYPHEGRQNADFGFLLIDNGDGEDPRSSDVIEWTKTGAALVGDQASGDALHRVQVRVLEEGDSSWGVRISRTGLYARVRPMAGVVTSSSATDDEKSYTFDNAELYAPVLIAKDVEGFNCRVKEKKPDSASKKESADAYEDEFLSTNALPYQVQMTFYVLKEDPDYVSQKTRVPLMRSVILPLHKQSLDGAALSQDTKGGRSK